MASNDDDAPLGGPAEYLALIERERANIVRDISPDPRLMYWPWGVAWFAGFTVFFLRYGPDGRVFVALPDWLPLLVLMTLIFAAGITTGVSGARVTRQVAGPSTRQGLLYGLTWSLAFTGLTTVFARVSQELSEQQAGLLWAGGMVALTGALHMAGGALWNDRDLFLLGSWITVINIAGIVAGTGWHSLIVAVAGGGGMLVAGLIGWMRRR